MDKLTDEIKSLQATVGNLNLIDLQTLSEVTLRNLKTQMEDPNSAFAMDPELALKAAQTVAKINTDTIESQRRVIDTLIRFKSLNDASTNPASNLIPSETAPQIEGTATSVFE